MDKTFLNKVTITPVVLLLSGMLLVTALQDWVVFIPNALPVTYTCIAAAIVLVYGRWATNHEDMFTSLLTAILNMLMAVSLVGNFYRFISLRDKCISDSHLAPEFCRRVALFLPGSITFLIITLVPTFVAYAYASFTYFRHFRNLREIQVHEDLGLSEGAVVGVPVHKP
jgi:hypothetical protein